ncbi:cell division protein FtsQ/DivIB [Roseospira visakhapatnamensis]|uniref:Cell division protein FtsQ n=1 Tax=Roseospira visakhapatnamensis TaxID=390880 RepID=A0A7W6RFB3_9PROT|nr:cell division protein FtsQ/DivIB [Roseospira visakhapatnamensis]MBB4267505.1 cell division protein FtsQ [Roseospira visakhapatnamensis]
MRWITGRAGRGGDAPRAAPARGGGRTRGGAGGGRARGGAANASTPRRKRPAPRRAPVSWGQIWGRLRLAGVGLLMIGLVAGAAWTWRSGLIGQQWAALGAAMDQLAMRGGLVVRSVTVEGRDRTSPTRLLNALGTGRGEPILRFDPHAARARVEALPWVAGARVERRLPDAIHVVLTEREPLALWQRRPDGDFAVIDQTGLPLTVDCRPFADLPVIVGAGAPGQVPDLMALLARQPALAARVRAATWVGGRRWTLRLDAIDDGIDIHLPEHDPADAWGRLAVMERQGRLLARHIDRVDLRLPDRLVVRPRPSVGLGGQTPEAPARSGVPALSVSTAGQET